ncbi:zinc finger protein 2-like [Hylaeus anthracinus]|uniref:zinc finger protein 2-like n=1 Tax=Hylaeus anthracinus TaxID=313031 RepID=UPI0023B9FFDB|nr:zinc finger protein 2-like [Hylaeus anthracinus]
MSKIAETTQNSAQPLFIECNGSLSLDQDEVPMQIKDPPTSDEEENRGMMDSVDFDDDIKQSMENDDFHSGEANYRSLSDAKDDSSLCFVNSDSLKTEVSDSSTLDIVKEEPCSEDPVKTVLVPVRDPVTKEIKNTYVPVEVKDESGLNIIKSILIPIKDKDGSVSYEIKKVIVPIKPELSLPKKNKKQSSTKQKSAKVKKVREKKPKQKEGKVIEKKKAKPRADLKNKERKNENKEKEALEEIPATNASIEEVDNILENLRTVCPVCQKTFKNEKQMGKHIFRDHRKPFRCKRCYESYVSQDALQEHLKTHEKDTYVECPFCHQKYKRMSGLRAHQIRVHSSVDPKTVREHNKEIFMAPDPEGHKPHPLWMKTYPCQYCENVYPQKSYLVAHKRIAHGIQKREPKTFHCNVCNKKFASESNLQSHASIHSQSYLCAHCGKSLANKYSLQLHTRKHTGERPYQCKLCSKSFASSVSLRVHRVTHTGERPYECDICRRRFTQRSSMMAHRRKHPGNHPPPPPLILRSRKNKGD